MAGHLSISTTPEPRIASTLTRNNLYYSLTSKTTPPTNYSSCNNLGYLTYWESAFKSRHSPSNQDVFSYSRITMANDSNHAHYGGMAKILEITNTTYNIIL